MKKLLTTMTIFCLMIGVSFGQGEANIWVFGEKITVDLSDPANPSSTATGFTGIAGVEGEGFASISDADGNLLVFTDGTRVYGSDGNIMPNGTGLGGDLSSAQAGVLIPQPGVDDPNFYWLFTASIEGSTGGVKYSQIDMGLNSGNGDVVTSQKNLQLTPASTYMTEALTVVPHFNGDDQWVITHGSGGSSTYYAYQVTNSGVSTTAVTSTGSLNIPLTTTPSLSPNSIGMIKSNSCFTQLAMSNLGTRTVEVTDFDNSTGQVTGVAHTITGFSSSLYGIEFSPSGRYLYVTEYADKVLYQFDLNTNPTTKADAINTYGPSPTSRLGQLQLGPGNQIYIANHTWGSGKSYLGAITDPDNGTDAGVDFEYYEFDFGTASQTVTMGLPQFAKDFVSSIANLKIDGVDASAKTVCVGESVQLILEVDGDASGTALWDIETSVDIPGNDISYTFNNIGDIPINVSVTDNCGRPKDVELEVQVLPAQLATVTQSCPGPTVTGTGANASNYAWYDAATDGNLLATGATYTPTTTPSTVYVEDATPLNGPFYVNESPGTANASTADNISQFNVLSGITIKSVDIKPFTWGASFDGIDIDIVIKDGVGATVATIPYTLTGDATQTVDLNTALDAGSDYTMEITGGWSSFNKYENYDIEADYFQNVERGANAWGNKGGPFVNYVIEEPYPCLERLQVDMAACCDNETPVAENNKSVCEGAALTVSATSTETSPSFIWSGPGITGADTTTSTSLSITSTMSAADSGWYYVYIFSAGCSADSEMDSVYVSMDPLPDDATSISPTDDVCQGDTVRYCISAVDNATGYDWTLPSNVTQESTTGECVDIIFNSGTSATLEVTPTNSCGDGASSDVTISINNIPTGTGSVSPTAAICENDDQAYTVSGITGADTYEWYVDNNATVTTGETDTETITADTLSFTMSIVPVNTCGKADTIKQAITVNVAPEITSQPDTVRTCENSSASFAVTATNADSYQWYNGTSPIASATSATYTINPVGLADAGNYTVEVTNTCGTVTSEVAELIITSEETPDVSLVVDKDEICEGDTVTFTASGSGGGANPTYYFFEDGNSTPLQSGSGTTYEIEGLTADASIVVAMKSTSTCIASGSSDSVSSSIVDVDVEATPDVAAITETSEETCEDRLDFNFAAVTTGNISWSSNNASVSAGTTSTTTARASSLPVASTVKVYLTVSGTLCPATVDSIEIERLDLSTPEAGDTVEICETASAPQLTGNVPGSGETGTWSAAGPATINSSTGQTASLAIGDNKFYYTLANAKCSVADSVIVSVDEMPTASLSSSSVTTCTNLVQLTADAPTVTGAVGTWVIASQPGTTASITDANDPVSNVTGLEDGTTTLNWSVTNGECTTSNETFTITKQGDVTAATIAINGGDFSNEDKTNESVEVCLSNAYTVTGSTPSTSAGETAIWSIVSGTSVTINEDATVSQGLTFSGTAGVTQLEWTITPTVAGCNPASGTIDIDVNLEPSAAVANDVDVCATFGNLSADAITNGTGTWTVSPTTVSITDANNPTSAFSGLTDGGSALATWTVSTGDVCPDKTDNAVLTSLGTIIPDVTIIASKDPVCFGEDVTFTANSGTGGNLTFAWNWIGGTESGTSNELVTNAVIEGGDVVVVMTTDLDCASPKTATNTYTMETVKSSPSPVINEADATICDDQDYVLTISGTNDFIWYKDGVEVGTGNSVIIDDLADAGNYVVVEDNGVCPLVESDTVTVQVDEKPNVNISPVEPIYADETTNLNATATVSTGTPLVTWSLTDGSIADINSTNTTFTPTEGGTYNLTLTAVNGVCTTEETTTVSVFQKIEVPNVFSPNEDGQNDNWVIEGLDTYPNAVLRVYNRWGSPVHTAINDIEPWNGLNNGNPMPIATYYYVLDLGVVDLPVLTGTVTIIK